MTDWRAIKPTTAIRQGWSSRCAPTPSSGAMPGFYHEGDIHSPRREGSTKLIRIEGMNLDGVPRGYFDPV